MMTSTRGAIFLIFFGALYLLYNLNLISFSPWGLLWPGLLIWFAGNQLVKTAKEGESQDSWNIALWLSVLALGIYMLLPKIGISVPKIPWGIVWPLVLIGIGAAKILTGKPDFIRFEIGSDKKARGLVPVTTVHPLWVRSIADQAAGHLMILDFIRRSALSISISLTPSSPIERLT